MQATSGPQTFVGTLKQRFQFRGSAAQFSAKCCVLGGGDFLWAANRPSASAAPHGAAQLFASLTEKNSFRHQRRLRRFQMPIVACCGYGDYVRAEDFLEMFEH